MFHYLIRIMLVWPLLAGCITLSAKQQNARPFSSENEFRRWFAFYYREPQPERIGAALLYMRDHGYLSEGSSRSADMPVIASVFISQIFIANESQIERWVADWRNLGSQEWYVILVGLRLADTPAMNRILEANLSRVDENHRTRLRKMQETDLRTLEPLTAEVMTSRQISLLWSGFSATGDLRYVKRVIDHINLFGSEDENDASIGEAAIMSLASYAMQHPAVRKLCLEERSQNEDPKTRILLDAMIVAIIKNAEQNPNDSSSR